MSNKTNSVREKQWTSAALREAVGKGEVTLKENDEGKAKCWQKFYLAVDQDRSIIFGWAVCKDCNCCVMYKSKCENGSVKLYGTTNLTDHMKTCYSSQGKQMTMNAYVKKIPGKNFAEGERDAVKDAEVRLVVEGGVSFLFVDNPGLRSFAQLMIQIGSKHGNVDVNDVLYGRQTIRNETFKKMKLCQANIKKQVALSSRYGAVSFCTDMTTDDINKNSYSDFTVFWVNSDWQLKHAMYKCEYFAEKHTAQNIQKFIDDTLTELHLSLDDTPCTTDRGSNIVAATVEKAHVDCACHRLNTAIDTAWKMLMSINDELQQLNSFSHELVKYANQASGIQSALPVSLKHGGETRPWRSLSYMFSSISESHEALLPVLRERKKEHLVARIDIDQLNEVVAFLKIFPSLFDLLEYANIATLQNTLPVYYTLYEAWQPNRLDSELLAQLKTEFLTALSNKFWISVNMLHFIATFLDPTLKEFVFVKNNADRDGFFRQIRDGLVSLAREPPAIIDSSVSVAAAVALSDSSDAEPTSSEPASKKQKASTPFDWFHHAANETTIAR